MSSRIIAAAAGAAIAMGATAVHAMTLEEAVGLAITTNPEVGAVANDRLAVDEELRQGKGLFYPQIDVRAAGGAEYSDNVTTEAQGRDSRTLFRKEAAVTLSQLLFDGFFASSEVQRQRARVRSAAYRVGEAAEFVGLDAVEGFLEVLRHRARVDIAEQNVQVHRDILASVQRRADIGGGGIGDVRQAEARFASARSALVQTQGDLRDAEALFIRVVGQAPESLSDPTVPAGMLPTDSEQAVAAAVENSPTVAFARADLETAEADVRQQEASLYPDFRAELGGTVADNIDGRTNTEYDATAMLVMRWNLYRGGADAARVREFKHRLAEANDTLRISERNVSEDARVSWNAMQVARANVVVLNENVEANRRTREIYRQQFDIGQRGLLDLLDSENELFLSRENLVTARYAELFANYRLLATSGALVKSLGLAAPEAAQLPAD